MKFYLFILLFVVSATGLFAQEENSCPRIYQISDTLVTDPAPNYQWYRNGVIIPGATARKYVPIESGNYKVAVGAVAPSLSYTYAFTPAALQVNVLDNQLKPIPEVKVTVNGQSIWTDANGQAYFPNAVASRTIIQASKQGYFDGFSSAYRPAVGAAISTIALAPIALPLTFNDSTAATIAATSGLKITFPAHAFVIEGSNQSYTGDVSVYFDHHEPDIDPLFTFAMPGGDFTAIAANGTTVALTSYGFFNAEIRGANGEELNLKPGLLADVEFRIPESMRATAPASMPLWAFDEILGIWKYDSELQKNENYYIGKVSHFSSWNCDYPGERCTVIATAVDCNGNPASNALVCLNQVCGNTDTNGSITFVNAPANIPLSIYSLQDTISIGIVAPGDTFIVSPALQAGENMLVMADYWLDSVQVFVYAADEPVLYSLDSINWQSEPLFVNVPFQNSVQVWVKDASNCPVSLMLPYKREPQAYSCVYPLSVAHVEQFTFTINELPSGNTPVYQILGCIPDGATLSWLGTRYACLLGLQMLGCGLSTLPSEIAAINSLVWIILKNNQITILPPEIGSLTNLQAIIMDQNQLVEITPEIGNLSALQYLSLEQNQLTTLPAEIGNLSAVTELNLKSNNISSLPAEIGNLTSIQTIYLNNNQLTSLPASIANLADSLNELKLQGNPIPVQDRPYYQSLLPYTNITW